MISLQTLAVALILTILIEYTIYLVYIRTDLRKLFLYCVLINSFTNPLLNYLFWFKFHELYVLEIMVAVVESLLIMLLLEICYPRAIFLSVVANLASLLIGAIILG